MNDFSGYCDDCKFWAKYSGRDDGCTHRVYKQEIPPPPKLPSIVEYPNTTLLEELEKLRAENLHLQDMVNYGAAIYAHAMGRNSATVLTDWETETGFRPSVLWAENVIAEDRRKLEKPSIPTLPAFHIKGVP